MFEQKGNIRDYVFPLVTATKDNRGIYSYGELIGTGFFIGNGGFGLTAAHVIDQLRESLPTNGVILALFTDGQNWHPYEVEQTEKHPTEDVGIIKVTGDWWQSFFNIDDYPHNSSAEYACWGYPKVVAQEIKKIQQGALERPELIYTQGYIRRRISRELEVSIYIGQQFYELSEIVGEGNSGGPVLLKKSFGQPKWQVVGVYIGEKASHGVDISYAVRAEAFANWTPLMLDRPIKDFSNQAE